MKRKVVDDMNQWSRRLMRKELFSEPLMIVSENALDDVINSLMSITMVCMGVVL